MPLTYIAFLSLATFALLNFLAIPRIERQLRVNRSAAVIGKAGTLSLLGFLQTVALIFGATAVLILLATAILERINGSSVPQLTAAIERAQGWRDALSRFDPIWSFFVLLLLVVAMWIVARKTGKQRVEKIFQEALDEDLKRLQREREAGSWPELPPTPPMEQLQARFAQLRTLQEQVEASQPNNPAEEAQRRRAQEAINGELQKIQSLYFQMDVARRVQVDLDPDRVAYPPPKNWKERIQYFFMSQGLMTGLRAGSRALFIAGFVLLELAFLGVQSSQMGTVLDARIVKLDQLRVAASEKEALEQWKAAQQGAAAAAQAWTADDEATANMAAARFEDGLAASQQWNPILPKAGVSLRELYVRQQILSRAVAGDTTERLAKYAALSEIPDLKPLTRETVHSYEEGFSGLRPKTEAGRRIYSTIREVSHTSPETWGRIKSSVKAGAASFQHPTTADDLTRMMLTRLMGGAADGLGSSGGELGQLLHHIDEAVGPDALRRAYSIKSSQYLSALAGGSPLDEAVRLIIVDRGSRPVWTQAEATSLKAVVEAAVPDGTKIEQHPPALFTKMEPHVATSEAVRMAEEIRSQLAIPRRSDAGAELTNALANFADHFPGQVGSERTTPRGQLLEKWASGRDDLASGFPLPGTGSRPPGSGPSGIGLEAPRPPSFHPPAPESFGSGIPTSRSFSSFARARSFFSLRGFSRIGGVLIGNDPTGPSSIKLDFRDLRWRQEGEKLRLLLVNAKGAEIDLGAFRPTLVRQALTYAADARPVTVTMVAAEPLRELKILLHPALVDTPLGCRAIELDRFVDILTGDHPARIKASETMVSQTNLYELAWAYRIKSIIEILTKRSVMEGGSDAVKELAVLSREAESRLGDPKVLVGALGALSDPEVLRNPKRSPLLAKPDFFDPILVGYMTTCTSSPDALATEKSRLEAFGSCIEKQAAESISEYLSDKEGKWYQPPPEFQIWSGVRERNFTLDPALSFLKSPAGEGTEAQLWPLDFMLQMAFTSAPVYAKQKADPEAYVDEAPWEFPSIAGVIPAEVAKGVRTNPEYQSILADMKEFTILQRLFRVAIRGDLGQRFPVERLVSLMDLTAAQRPRRARTLRWNPRPGLLEASLRARLAVVSERLDKIASEGAVDTKERDWILEANHSIRGCRDLIANSKQPASIPQDQWTARCSLDALGKEGMQYEKSEAGRLVAGTTKVTNLTTYARKMRSDLGVPVDDGQAMKQRSCPAI